MESILAGGRGARGCCRRREIDGTIMPRRTCSGRPIICLGPCNPRHRNYQKRYQAEDDDPEGFFPKDPVSHPMKYYDTRDDRNVFRRVPRQQEIPEPSSVPFQQEEPTISSFKQQRMPPSLPISFQQQFPLTSLAPDQPQVPAPSAGPLHRDIPISSTIPDMSINGRLSIDGISSLARIMLIRISYISRDNGHGDQNGGRWISFPIKASPKSIYQAIRNYSSDMLERVRTMCGSVLEYLSTCMRSLRTSSGVSHTSECTSYCVSTCVIALAIYVLFHALLSVVAWQNPKYQFFLSSQICGLLVYVAYNVIGIAIF